MIHFFLKFVFFFLGTLFWPKIFWLLLILFFDYFFDQKTFLLDLLIFSLLFDLFFWPKIGLTLAILSLLFWLASFLKKWLFFDLRGKLILGFIFSLIFSFSVFFLLGLKNWYNIFLLSLPTTTILLIFLTLTHFFYGRTNFSSR